MGAWLAIGTPGSRRGATELSPATRAGKILNSHGRHRKFKFKIKSEKCKIVESLRDDFKKKADCRGFRAEEGRRRSAKLCAAFGAEELAGFDSGELALRDIGFVAAIACAGCFNCLGLWFFFKFFQ
jgi:hypothetical protein